jgi:putative hydrolases of HD superfamily
MTSHNLDKILSVISLAENLKKEPRHCWYDNGRRESVAEHTWRMSLMAILIAPELEKSVDMSHLLKIIIIHDLVETLTGDIPIFMVNTPEKKAAKHLEEKAAMERIAKMLDSPTGDELFTLWEEYEAGESPEARVAKALDKLEGNIQHNEAPLETWIEKNHEIVFGIDKFCTFDTTMLKLCEKVRDWGVSKMLKGGVNVSAVVDRINYQKPVKPLSRLQDVSNIDLEGEIHLDSEPNARA